MCRFFLITFPLFWFSYCKAELKNRIVVTSLKTAVTSKWFHVPEMSFGMRCTENSGLNKAYPGREVLLWPEAIVPELEVPKVIDFLSWDRNPTRQRLELEGHMKTSLLKQHVFCQDKAPWSASPSSELCHL